MVIGVRFCLDVYTSRASRASPHRKDIWKPGFSISMTFCFSARVFFKEHMGITMMRSRLIACLLGLAAFGSAGLLCFGFAPGQLTPRQKKIPRISLWSRDEEEREIAAHNNEARVDVRNLLTQRAIQSFMFLLTSVRDPHSAKWVSVASVSPKKPVGWLVLEKQRKGENLSQSPFSFLHVAD